MNLWSRLFGSDNVVSAGIKAIDVMVFTDEEKSKAKQAFLKLYEPFKLAQRYLAMTFAPAYVFAQMVTFFIEVANVLTESTYNTDKLYSMLQGDFGTMTATIVLFYFGGGAVEGIVNRYNKKGRD